MRINMTKRLSVTLYCLARQAERSLDFALSSARQWSLLRDYYHPEKLAQVNDLLRSLEQLAPSRPGTVSRGRFAEITPGWIVRYPVLWLVNHWRGQWEFSGDELSFFIDVISRFVHALSREQQPDNRTLVDLRMDLFMCQTILEQRLIGIPLGRTSRDIEHFCQADHIQPVSLNQVHHLLGTQTA